METKIRRFWLLFSLSLALGTMSSCGSSSSIAIATGGMAAASCSSSDVQAAINSATNGQVVNVPGGTCTWSSVVTIPSTLGITLNGGGTTTITGQLDITQNASTTTRITGFTWTSSGNCGSANAISTHGTFSPPSAAFRIDHNTFTVSVIGTSICIDGNAPGLFDHNTANIASAAAADEFIHNLGMGADDASGWTTDVVPGSSNMVFIEDNTFTYSCSGNPCYFFGSSAVQSYYGARTVFRHNTLTMMQIDQHGTCGGIWARWWEIYDNTFVEVPNANQSQYMALRGGSGVAWGNTVTNPSNNGGAGNVSLIDDCNGTYPDPGQVGRGLNQNLSPAYLWANDPNILVESETDNIQLNGDYHVSAIQPVTLQRCQSAADVSAGCPVSYSYVPYTYPHPLQGN